MFLGQYAGSSFVSEPDDADCQYTDVVLDLGSLSSVRVAAQEVSEYSDVINVNMNLLSQPNNVY